MEGHKKNSGDQSSKEEEKKHSKEERPMGKPFPRDEIEKLKGYYDSDGFYILEEDGSFFDPWGYKFDSEGYD
jgi:hypothetical protein